MQVHVNHQFNYFFLTATGPTSYLAICSEPGIDWVLRRTGGSDFICSAMSLACGITALLKLDRGVDAERVPDPDVKTAWMYSNGLKLSPFNDGECVLMQLDSLL